MTIRRQLDVSQLHVAARALGRTAGSGARGWTLWRFGAGTLEIEHAGVAYTLDAPGDGVGNGRTGEPSITSVVGELPNDGTVVVEVSDGRLRFVDASWSWKWFPIAGEARLLLPVDGDAGHLLALNYGKERQALADAGLDDQVAALEERLAETCARVAEAVRWLHIRPEHVRRWIEQHLAQLADGPPAPPRESEPRAPRVVVVESDGQVRLFGDLMARSPSR